MDEHSEASGSGGRGKDTVKYKIFNDSVHGHIKMHPLLVKIIDTPEFQRLKNIKQLGGGYYVFPGASHNRFEHSIGVAHLAGELIRSLRTYENLKRTSSEEKKEADEDELKKQEAEKDEREEKEAEKDEREEKEAEKDELCVQIAGLCHDLGHGPFSHAFEVFMKEANPESVWKHEEVSVKMFEQLIRKDIRKNSDPYTIEQIMEKKHGFSNRDIVFIEELIYGPNPPTERSRNLASLNQENWPYKGRGKEKSYLYEIVANKRTGIDVDKMDYFSRDCLHLGMKSNFSHERYVMFARVCTNENKEKQICMRDKEALNVYELFHVRYLLHHNAYQHRVTKAIEMMIVDALLAAESKNFMMGNKKISEIAVDDHELYLRLTDDILQQIKAFHPDPKCIIERIEQRNIYRCIGSKIFKPAELEDMTTVQGMVKTWLKCTEKNLCESDFKVTCVKIDYGMKNENPIDSLRFYKKDNETEGIKLPANEISYIRPDIFYEVKVMLFYIKTPVPEVTQMEKNYFWKLIRKFPEA